MRARSSCGRLPSRKRGRMRRLASAAPRMSSSSVTVEGNTGSPAISCRWSWRMRRSRGASVSPRASLEVRGDLSRTACRAEAHNPAQTPPLHYLTTSVLPARPELLMTDSRPTVYVETYGCQMNVSDSELMLGKLAAEGYSAVDQPDGADVILV